MFYWLFSFVREAFSEENDERKRIEINLFLYRGKQLNRHAAVNYAKYITQFIALPRRVPTTICKIALRQPGATLVVLWIVELRVAL